MGELKKDQDFKIKTVGALTTNKVKIDNWAMPKSILMIRKDITMAVYRKRRSRWMKTFCLRSRCCITYR